MAEVKYLIKVTRTYTVSGETKVKYLGLNGFKSYASWTDGLKTADGCNRKIARYIKNGWIVPNDIDDMFDGKYNATETCEIVEVENKKKAPNMVHTFRLYDIMATLPQQMEIVVVPSDSNKGFVTTPENLEDWVSIANRKVERVYSVDGYISIRVLVP